MSKPILGFLEPEEQSELKEVMTHVGWPAYDKLLSQLEKTALERLAASPLQDRDAIQIERVKYEAIKATIRELRGFREQLTRERTSTRGR